MVRDVTTARDVLRQPAVRRYMISMSLAAVGLNIIVTVLFKQVFDITGDALDIGLLGLAQFLPAILLVLVSGWAADRFDRRHVSGLFLFGRGLCAVALVAYSWGSSSAVWPLFLIALGLGTSDAMLSPARRSMTPLIASPEDFPRVIALWTGTTTGAAIVGPILGGFLYSAGPSLAYGLAATLEFLAIIPILSVVYRRTSDRPKQRPTLSTAMEGLHFVRRTPLLLAMISLDLFAVLFGGAIALIPAVASERLGVGDIAYGWLRAAPGIGAALMAIWLAVRPAQRRVGASLLWSVAIFGIGTMVFGITTNYVVAFVALIAIAGADMISMYVRATFVPLMTPDDQLGRVSAVESVFIGASNELGAFESGVTARAFGLPISIAGGGLLTVVVAAGFAVFFPRIRAIDTFDQVRIGGSVDSWDDVPDDAG